MSTQPPNDQAAADRERQRIAALDDATVARMHAMSPSPALADEIGRRLAFEAQWAGEPIPPPTTAKHFRRKI